MKAIVYGVGKHFEYYFNNFEFVDVGTSNNIEVIGFADGNSAVWGREILYNEQKFLVKDRHEFCETDIEKIIITSTKYFDEIRDELIQEGYREEQILSVDVLLDKYFEKIYLIEKFEGKSGIEIGGPSQLFSSIYEVCSSCDNVNYNSNTVWQKNESDVFQYGNKELGRFIVADATNMQQIGDNKYDFVLSSNNLEHIANPLKALKEFARILKTGGIVLVLVPIKDKIFDHNRECTTFEHLMEDYRSNIGEDDLTHLPEIISKHDYDMDVLCGGKEQFIERAKKNVENRCLHHHVFEEVCLRKAFEFVGLEVIAFGKVMNNWLIIGCNN